MVSQRQNSLVLLHGLILTDRAPGQVRRYKNTATESNAWITARVLFYSFMKFPCFS